MVAGRRGEQGNSEKLLVNMAGAACRWCYLLLSFEGHQSRRES